LGYFTQAGMLGLLYYKQGCLGYFPQAGMLGLLYYKQGCLGYFTTSKDAWVTLLQARMLGLLCVCVRDAEGGETTPSFGHPSNVRRGEAGTAFGAERVAKFPKDC